jgi:predicted outer membrane repeat protein
MRGIGAVLVRRAVLLLAVSALGVLAWGGVASAASFTVNDPTDAALATSTDTNCASTNGGSCTLRAAVQAADNSGDSSTITVPAGTYKLTIASTAANDPTTGDLDVNNNATVAINGAGSGSTIIDANGIDRAFAVQSGASLSISGVTIEHGDALTSGASNNSTKPGYGGAIYNDGTLSVTDSTLDHNQADDYGGAIYADTGAISTTVSGSDVSYDNIGSTSGMAGGAGIEVDGGNMSVSNSTIDYDAVTYGDDGGLVWNSSGTGSITDTAIGNDSGWYAGALGDYGGGPLTISNSDVSHDSTQEYDGYSGGIYYTGSGTLSVTGSTISDDAGGYGGGVYLAGSGAVTLSQDTLADDSSVYGYGGGIYDQNGAAVTVSADTFNGNSADQGGGVYFNGSTEQLTNDTFDGNSGYYGASIYLNTAGASLTNDTIARGNGVEGGGIYQPAKASAIANTIVADNQGGDCYSGPAGTTADQGNNLDGDSSCFATGGTGTTPESGDDLVSTNPDLGSLADNGGPTETDALLVGSPAIDAGSDAVCQMLNAPNPPTDQRGVPRPQGVHCDVGAFEAAAAHLSASNGAPASGTTGVPFAYTVTVTAGGPGPSSGTTVTDQLPAGETLYGATPSQGSCSSSGSPAKVTCALGAINVSGNATVTLLVAEANAGSVTDSATVTNDQGANVSAPATTNVVAPAPTTTTTTTTTIVVSPAAPNVGAPTAITGGHSHVTKHSAMLSGTVSTGGQSTWYFFQYGTTRSLGEASGFFKLGSSGSVAATIQRLLAGKKYFFRLVAVNDTGVSQGAEHSFKTKNNHHT